MSILRHTHFHSLVRKSLRLNYPSSLRRLSGFSFAGPRKLEEIMKTELLEDKTKAEVSDIWMTYHESKERVHGTTVPGDVGKNIIDRAEKMYVES